MRNRVVRQARRLRRPRYAIGFLLAGLYVWVVFAQPGTAPPAMPLAGAGRDFAALALTLLAARWWLFGDDRTALAFEPAEVHFLFPAPLARWQLVLWKLARAQLGIAVSAMIWTTVATRGSPLPWVARVAAFWVLFAVLQLHRFGASLVRSGATEGSTGLRRSAVSIALFAAAALALAWSIAADLDAIRAAGGGMASARAIGIATHRLPARMALLPAQLLLAPTVAQSAVEWLRAMLPALALLVAHAAWVLRRDAAFEEAALEASERRARRLAARGALGARQAPGERPRTARGALPLPAWGGPAAAIVWKNLVAQRRALHPAVLLRVLGAFAVGFLVASLQLPAGSAGELLAIFLSSWVALLVAAGPLWVRNDLRLDIAQLETLRAWPLRGRTIVAAELAASAIALTTAQLVVTALALAALLATGVLARVPGQRMALGAALLVALPALNVASLTIQNALAVHFPDLVRRGLASGGGIETIGQNMLSAIGALVLLAVLLLLPVAAALPVVWLLGWGAGSLALGAVVLSAVLAVETWGVVRWLGRVLERAEVGVA